MEKPEPSSLPHKLAAIPFLRGLDAEVLTSLARTALWRSFPAGAILFLEGEAAAGLYQVHSGWIKVVKMSPEGREQVLRFLGPGETFNEIGVFGNRPNPATAIALEPTGLWLIERTAIRRLLETHPVVAVQVLERMADRVIELVGLVADLSLRTVEARLARLLLEQSAGDVVARQRWATQTELAARLGTVPDVLSRAMRGLVEAGLIEVERQHIRILDRAGLELRAMVGG
jgi:CRP/FNR family transcriptional regulator